MYNENEFRGSILNEILDEAQSDFETLSQQTISQNPPNRQAPKKVSCSSRRNCWEGTNRGSDIVDTSIPWNTPDNRSPENIIRAIEFLNPTMENPRYKPGNGKTWCNIFVSDVTRILNAPVPHWYKSAKGLVEISPNTTYELLKKEWKNKIGWFVIDKGFSAWLVNCKRAGVVITPPNQFITKGILNAVLKIISSPSLLQNLLYQPGYIAQQFANLGLPTIVIWKNPDIRKPGHVALIRPEKDVKACIGLKCEPPSNENSDKKFVPVTAQAGSRNWENEPAKNFINLKDELYFIHE